MFISSIFGNKTNPQKVTPKKHVIRQTIWLAVSLQNMGKRTKGILIH
jgi:hypothetical protein